MTNVVPTQERQRATLRYLHIAPRKVRLVADTLRGLPVREAEAQLIHRLERSARPLLKLLRSAIADASHTKKLEPVNLVVAELRVDEAPRLKRFLPRAQGRATPILKRSSHVTLVLEAKGPQRDRFIIAPPKKKTKKEQKKPKRPAQPAGTKGAVSGERQHEKGHEKGPGFFRRIFRRKSV